MAKKYIPDFRAGDTYPLEIIYENGTNIMGYKVWLTLKIKFTDDDSQAILQVSTIAGSYPLDDPLHGKCWLVISAAVTAKLPVGNYYYDLQVKSVADEVTTILPPTTDFRSKVAVVPQVTRAS